MKCNYQQLSEWFFDNVCISKVTVQAKGIYLDIRFLNVLGQEQTLTVLRDDIFFHWPQVIQAMVNKGYRFNIAKGGDGVLRERLAEAVSTNVQIKDAITRQKKSQNEKDNNEIVIETSHIIN